MSVELCTNSVGRTYICVYICIGWLNAHPKHKKKEVLAWGQMGVTDQSHTHGISWSLVYMFCQSSHYIQHTYTTGIRALTTQGGNLRANGCDRSVTDTHGWGYEVGCDSDTLHILLTTQYSPPHFYNQGASSRIISVVSHVAYLPISLRVLHALTGIGSGRY